MTQRFTDRVVVITGAAGGLGREAAQAFAAEGAALVLADIDESGLEQTRALVGVDCACTVSRLDLADEAAITAFGAEVCARHPRVHVLYNNAGIAYGEVTGPVDSIDMRRWQRYLAVNSIAPLLLAKALRPALAAARGVILNQSSMAANMPSTVYGVTKATLNSMTYAMASIFGTDGIRANAIAPGLMETPAARQGLPAGTIERIRGMQMLKDREGSPADIARLALFLASDEAGFITGEVVGCDGGNMIRGWRH